MAASAVIALTAFSTLGAATLASPFSYGRFPCSVWGSDNKLHGGEPSRQVSLRVVSSPRVREERLEKFSPDGPS